MRHGSREEQAPLLLNDDSKVRRADGLTWFSASFFMIGQMVGVGRFCVS